VDDYQYRQGELNGDDLARYKAGKESAAWSARQKLNSPGREGLGEMLRNCLALTTREPHQDDISSKSASEGVEGIFDALFQETCNGVRKVDTCPDSQYENELELPLLFADSKTLTRVGNLWWHQCILRTPSSEVQYGVFELFIDPLLSAVHCSIQRRDFNDGRKLENPISRESESPQPQLWEKLQ